MGCTKCGVGPPVVNPPPPFRLLSGPPSPLGFWNPWDAAPPPQSYETELFCLPFHQKAVSCSKDPARVDEGTCAPVVEPIPVWQLDAG